jgi:hypothetical protein
VHLAVQPVEVLEHPHHLGRGVDADADPGGNRGQLERHRRVHHVGEVREPGHRTGRQVVGQRGHPVRGLGEQQPPEVEQPLLAGTFVEPEHGDNVLRAASLGPAGEGTVGKLGGLVTEVAGQQSLDAVVVGRVRPLGERLQRDHARPPVVVADRPELPVRSLARDDGLDPGTGAFLELHVVEDEGQRDQPVEVVRAVLPSLPVAAEPSARGTHVLPELRQAAGLPVSLQPQLVGQPPRRPHGPQGQLTQRGTRDLGHGSPHCVLRRRREPRWRGQPLAAVRCTTPHLRYIQARSPWTSARDGTIRRR